MTEEDANILRTFLIRIRTDPKLLNTIIRFEESSVALDCSWKTGVSSTLNNNNASSAKLANILILLLL